MIVVLPQIRGDSRTFSPYSSVRAVVAIVVVAAVVSVVVGVVD